MKFKDCLNKGALIIGLANYGTAVLNKLSFQNCINDPYGGGMQIYINSGG